MYSQRTSAPSHAETLSRRAPESLSAGRRASSQGTSGYEGNQAALHRLIGVAPQIQRKLVIAATNHPLEAEADQAANHELAHTLQRSAAPPERLRRQTTPAASSEAAQTSTAQGESPEPATSQAAQGLAPGPPQLVQSFQGWLAEKNWPEAAESLNGFSVADIRTLLKGCTAEQVAGMHQGALHNPRVGPNSNVAQMTLPAASNPARDGVVRALKLINPGQDETSNIVPYDGNNAQVKDLSKLDTSGWSSGFSAHGDAHQKDVPGYSDLQVKLYLNDKERNNLTTIGLEHSGFSHVADYLTKYSPIMKDPDNRTNADIAQGFCAKVQGGCP